MIEFTSMTNFMRHIQATLERSEPKKQYEIILPLYGWVQDLSKVHLLFVNTPNSKDQGFINYFLDEVELNWNLLEIQGQRGSGKKTLARQVEKFIWEQTCNNQIPIFVDIEIFHRQKNKNLDFILQQFPYLLKDQQIQELKQYVKNQNLQLVLIINTCNTIDEYQEIIKLHDNIDKEWKNSKVIRFIDSNIKSIRQCYSKTIILNKLSNQQIHNYFAQASRKYAHSTLLELYLDLKLDQKQLENFRKQIDFLLIQDQQYLNAQAHSIEKKIFEIIGQMKSKGKSQYSLIEKVKKDIEQFLHYETIIKIFFRLELDSLFRTPYLLFIISKFYPKLYDEEYRNKFFVKLFELYYFYEKLYQNKLHEKNFHNISLNKIIELNCKQIIQTEDYGKQQNYDFTIVQFIKENSEFHIFIQCYAWAEYVNQVIIAVRQIKDHFIENTTIRTEKYNENILNYLRSDKNTYILRCYNISEPQFLFNQDFNKQIFIKRITDKQTLNYLFLLTQEYLWQSQIFLNIKAIIHIFCCPIISNTFENYHFIMTQALLFSCLENIKSEYISLKQTKQKYSSIYLQLQDVNNKKKTNQWNQYQGELLDFLKAEWNEELKTCLSVQVKRLYFKKQMALFIIPHVQCSIAVTTFGPFMAIAYCRANRIMLLSIRNLKVLRKLTINSVSSPLNNVSCLALSQDCQYIAACQGKTLLLWNIQTNLREITFPSDDSQILACQFLTNTELLISKSNFCFYKVALEKLILSFQTPSYFQKQLKTAKIFDKIQITIPNNSSGFIAVKLLQCNEKILVQLQIQGLNPVQYLVDLEFNSTKEELRKFEKLAKLNQTSKFVENPIQIKQMTIDYFCQINERLLIMQKQKLQQSTDQELAYFLIR